jgi:transposase
VDLREILNAIRYMARSAGGWRMSPTDFGPWQTVYWWFRRFVRRRLFRTVHDIALMMDRERVGREASPSAAVIDSQTIKAPMRVSVVTMPTRRSLNASATLRSTRMAAC